MTKLSGEIAGKRFRNEWKYVLPEPELAVAEGRLKGLLTPDGHAGRDGRYTVSSLYFDDCADSCASDNDAGSSRRFKWRIRYYGDDPSHLFLERKEKENALCRKQSAQITHGQFEQLAAGRAEELIYTADSELLRKFCVQILTRRFAPKAVIRYDRAAYVEEASNVRVTLDENIEVSRDVACFLSGDGMFYPVLPHGRHVLEVKFDDLLPGYLKSALSGRNMTLTAMSKYYQGRLALLRMGRY